MAEKQDIPMSQFPVVTSLSYVYGEKSNNQNKIAVEDLAKQIGIFRERFNIPAGGQVELPFTGGLIIIQDYSSTYDKAVSTLHFNGNGTVILPSIHINFFSEVEGKVCVFNTGTNTNYVIKNKNGDSHIIVVTFIR